MFPHLHSFLLSLSLISSAPRHRVTFCYVGNLIPIRVAVTHGEDGRSLLRPLFSFFYFPLILFLSTSHLYPFVHFILLFFSLSFTAFLWFFLLFSASILFFLLIPLHLLLLPYSRFQLFFLISLFPSLLSVYPSSPSLFSPRPASYCSTTFDPYFLFVIYFLL